MHTLIIDDDDISIYLSKQALKTAGISGNVSSFLSAEKALIFLKQNSFVNIPDIIFLDINMPVMNGWEFLQALQPYEQQLTGRCHIYILTSSLALSEKIKSKDYALVNGFIHKPIHQKDIHIIFSRIEVENYPNKIE